MKEQSILEDAITRKKSIQFEYSRNGKADGIRVGDPHAIYISPLGKTVLDFFQTSGVSASVSKGKRTLPVWDTLLVKHMTNIQILEDKSFTPEKDFKPNSDRYAKAIIKVQ